MTDGICAGTMFIEDGTVTPKPLDYSKERHSPDWSAITKAAGIELGRDLDSAGWTFFYMAGEVRANGFGFNASSRVDHALTRVIEAVTREHCNCLEITQVSFRSFLGVPYTNLAARSRHIQKSRTFEQISVMPISA